MRPHLVVDDLSVSVRGISIVEHISFVVGAGERVALIGASGSGKSVTAAAVLGTLASTLTTTGSITLDGAAILPHGPAGRGGAVAGVSQDSSAALNPLVRVGSQLVVPLRRRTKADRKDGHQAVLDLLRSVGIEDPERVVDAYPAELSGGQRQRVCIAMALVGDARLLVADEPTTALDVVNQARVLRTLRDYCDRVGSSTLFITHDLAVASVLCDRLVVLAGGAVVESGPVAALLADPVHPYTRSLVESVRASYGARPVAVA